MLKPIENKGTSLTRLAKTTQSQIMAEHLKTNAMLMLEHELMNDLISQTLVKLIGTDFQVQVSRWSGLHFSDLGICFA